MPTISLSRQMMQKRKSNQLPRQKDGRFPKKIKPQEQVEVLQFAEIERRITQLTGLEIFEIFYEQDNFQELIDNGDKFPETIKSFMWRLKYLLGEIILHTQRFLLNQGFFKDALILQPEDVGQIVDKIIQKAKAKQQNEQFRHFKKNMQLIYKLDKYESPISLTVYGIALKYWKPQTIIETKLDYESIEETKERIRKQNQSKSFNIKHILGSFSDVKNKKNQRTKQRETVPQKAIMVSQVKPYVPDDGQNIYQGQDNQDENLNNKQIPKEEAPQSINPPPVIHLQTSQVTRYTPPNFNRQNQQKAHENVQPQQKLPKIESQPQVEEVINLNSKNQGNKKWPVHVQTYFCNIYGEYDSYQMIRKKMENKFSPSPHWASPQQMEIKVYSIVNRVFSKIEGLNLSSPPIVSFLKLKALICSKENISDLKVRQQIYRKIFTIYVSMINGTPDRKEVLIHSISEINSIFSKYIDRPK